MPLDRYFSGLHHMSCKNNEISNNNAIIMAVCAKLINVSLQCLSLQCLCVSHIQQLGTYIFAKNAIWLLLLNELFVITHADRSHNYISNMFEVAVSPELEETITNFCKRHVLFQLILPCTNCLWDSNNKMICLALTSLNLSLHKDSRHRHLLDIQLRPSSFNMIVQ